MSVQIFVPDAGSSPGAGEALKNSVVLGKAIASTVSANSKTTVLTISAVVDTYITSIICSGMEYGKWFLTVDTVDQMIRRGGPGRDVIWEFVNPFKVSSGSVFDLKVEHFVTGETPDFEGTVLGYT